MRISKATPNIVRRMLFALPLSALVAIGAPGCGGSQKKQEVRPDSQLLGIELRGDTETEKYDINGDGRADLFRIHVLRGPKEKPEAQTRLLARQDLDLNFDDIIDLRRYFNEAGVVVREEMDLDFDGQFDATDYYADGVLYRRDMALNFEGKASVVKYYTSNKLVRKERDTNGDNRMDTFEYFENGRLVRIGIDRDGDEVPDVYTENNTPPPQAAPPPTAPPADKAPEPASPPAAKPVDTLE